MKVVVCGGCGFIGHHLANRLKKDGHFVRIVDIKKPIYPTNYDEFMQLDLRDEKNCRKAVKPTGMDTKLFDEVYQLAADMGGMGFIGSHDTDCLHNSVLINANMIHASVKAFIKRYFFSSSVCVYRDMKVGEGKISEKDAYPAEPDNEYGWEKLYSERAAMAYGRYYPTEVRIARFQNCYGPEGTWDGGREKAPAAICRKIAQAEDKIDIWGDGSAVRGYTYIDDLVDGILKIIHSNFKTPVNIGTDEYVTVDELISTIEKVAGKKVKRNYVEGPVGVQARCFSKKRLKSLGWKCKTTLFEGIKKTYPWILKEVIKS